MHTFVEADICKCFLVSIKVNTRMVILCFPQICLRSVRALLCFHQPTQSASSVPSALISSPPLSTNLKVSIVLAQRRQSTIGAQVRINELIRTISSAVFIRIRPQRRHIRVAFHSIIALQIRQRLIQERLDILRRTICLEIIYPDLLALGQFDRLLDRLLELGEAGVGGGGGVEPVDADHVDGAAALVAQIEELREPVDVGLGLQQPGRAEFNVIRGHCPILHQVHIFIHGARRVLMIAPRGIRLAEAEENPLVLFDGAIGVLSPFVFRGAHAVVLRDEVFRFVPVGRRGGVPICDPADVGFVGVGERNIALVVGLGSPACGGDDAALARAAAGAGY